MPIRTHRSALGEARQIVAAFPPLSKGAPPVYSASRFTLLGKEVARVALLAADSTEFVVSHPNEDRGTVYTDGRRGVLCRRTGTTQWLSTGTTRSTTSDGLEQQSQWSSASGFPVPYINGSVAGGVVPDDNLVLLASDLSLIDNEELEGSNYAISDGNSSALNAYYSGVSGWSTGAGAGGGLWVYSFASAADVLLDFATRVPALTVLTAPTTPLILCVLDVPNGTRSLRVLRESGATAITLATWSLFTDLATASVMVYRILAQEVGAVSGALYLSCSDGLRKYSYNDLTTTAPVFEWHQPSLTKAQAALFFNEYIVCLTDTYTAVVDPATGTVMSTEALTAPVPDIQANDFSVLTDGTLVVVGACQAGANGFVQVLTPTPPPSLGPPETDPDVAFWYRAQDVPDVAAGGLMWAPDARGYRGAIQTINAVSAHRPTRPTAVLNGYPAIRFNGGQLLFMLNTVAYTNPFNQVADYPLVVFAVVRASSLAGCFVGQGDKLGGYENTYQSSLNSDAGLFRGSARQAGVGPQISSITGAAAFSVVTLRMVSGAFQLYVDGVLEATSSLAVNPYNSYTFATLGGTAGDGTLASAPQSPLTGDIVETFGVKRAVSAADQIMYEDYLRTKYNL